MFNDSHVTKITPWSVTEESAGLPAVNYPAFVGTGLLGVGLDAAGLQHLPDALTTYFGCRTAPFHCTQADLYVLHEGLISEHLYQSEVLHTGCDVPEGGFCYGQCRNFMPLGYLDQVFELGGERIEGEAVLAAGEQWRRHWDLHHAVVTNRFVLGRAMEIETEVFAPHGSETVYVRLTRRPWGRRQAPRAEAPFRWTVRLPLRTRHGLAIFDQPGAVTPGERTILATIDEGSTYKPSEPYAIVYGVAADGMAVETSPEGWSASMSGPADKEQTALLRLDFVRLAGEATAEAASRQGELEQALAAFDAEAHARAKAEHVAAYEAFWAQTADVAVEDGDALELRRRLLLHVSEYLLRCGNDFSFGGTAQFLLFHQNGWGASNFHDHQYIVDGVARANLFAAAEANARWMRRVMRPAGRAFPWMMPYDGRPAVPPERDRAPMSDANRALLAMRIYELAGRGRDKLLREVVYPIVERVASLGADEWFYEESGRLLFRGVETDVMGAEAIPNDLATVLMYLSVIKKAIAYSERLGVDAERRDGWRRVLEAVEIETAAGRYKPDLNAPPDARASTWLCNIYYIAEAREFLDDATYARTADHGQRVVAGNLPWCGFAAAASEIRLGRADRAEQFFVDSLENRLHGLGYFEECTPIGRAALPPFATAHGAHVVAACEQVVLSDFWRPRVWIGRGLPSKLRAARVRFHSLRARDGLIVGGRSTPRRLEVDLHHTGEPVEMELVLSVPCEAGMFFTVRRDGQPVEHEFAGETVSLRLPLESDQRTTLVVEG